MGHGQNFGRTVTQELIESSEKVFDLVFTRWHFGDLLPLQYISPGRAGDLQGFAEYPGQAFDAEKHRHLVFRRQPAVITQQRMGLPQADAALGTITTIALIDVITARTRRAAYSE